MPVSRKSIFITGAGSGIGRACALHFLAQGWSVGASDVDQAALATLSATSKGSGGGSGALHTYRLDVRDRSDWSAALAEFDAVAGDRLDVLFNNAGIGYGGPFGELDEAKARTVVEINLLGVMNGLFAALPYLRATARAHGRARAIQTGSVAGIIAGPGMSIYAATKHGVRALTESLNLEMARENIDVLEIQPWFLDTAILDTAVAGGNRSGRERLTAAGVPVLPVSLAVDAVWLAATADKPPVHALVGAPARRVALLERFAPWLVRARAGATIGGES